MAKRAMMWRGAMVAMICGAMVLAGGCRKAAPDIHHYQVNLGVPPETVLSEAPSAWTIGVEYLTADSAYDDIRMIYRKSAYRLDYYHYHRWSAPPSVMVTDALREGLLRSGQFRAVTGGYGRGVDAVLRGRLIALEEVDRSEQEWVAHVALDLALEDARTGALLWARTLRREVAVEEQNPEGVARATSEALGDLITELTPALLAAYQQGASTQAPPVLE